MQTGDDDSNIWKLSLSLLISARLLNSTLAYYTTPLEVMKRLLSQELQSEYKKIIDAVLLIIMDTRLPASFTGSHPTWSAADLNELWGLFKAKNVSNKCQNKLALWRESVNALSACGVGTNDVADSVTASLHVNVSDSVPTILPLLCATVDILLGADNPEVASIQSPTFDVGATVCNLVEAAIRRSPIDELHCSSVNVFGSAVTGLQMQSLNSDVDLMVKAGTSVDSSAESSVAADQRNFSVIREAEDDLMMRSTLAESLDSMEYVLTPFRNEAKNILKSFSQAPSVSKMSPTEPEGSSASVHVSPPVAADASLPAKKKLRRDKRKHTSGDTGTASKSYAENLLRIVNEGMAVLREVAADGCADLLRTLNVEQVKFPDQMTTTELKTERKRIKALKVQADKSGDGGNSREKFFLKKVMTQLRKSGFKITEYVLHARIPVISFSTRIAVPLLKSAHKYHNPNPPHRVVQCDLTMYRPYPIINSAMIRGYVDWDASGHLKKLLMLVKRFAKHQSIGSAADGYLSSYSWVLLTLHVLLRDGLIPSLQLEPSSPHGFRFDDGNLRAESVIAEIAVPVLFYRVLEYYSSEYDVMNSVVTLRGQGEAAPKNIWPRYYRWRFSIEDPFERADTQQCRDLGVTLRVQPQMELFAILSAARDCMKRVLCSSGTSEEMQLEIFEKIFDSRESLFECMPATPSFVKKKKSEAGSAPKREQEAAPQKKVSPDEAYDKKVSAQPGTRKNSKHPKRPTPKPGNDQAPAASRDGSQAPAHTQHGDRATAHSVPGRRYQKRGNEGSRVEDTKKGDQRKVATNMPHQAQVPHSQGGAGGSVNKFEQRRSHNGGKNGGNTHRKKGKNDGIKSSRSVAGP